jgi:hypothetical protein
MANMRQETRTDDNGTKTTIYVYDETEFELMAGKDLDAYIKANYDTLWQMYEPCRFTEYNPVVR